MTVRAYVLIQCDAARAGAVSGGLKNLAVSHAKVLSADTASGPFDVIALLESPDLDGLGRAVSEGNPANLWSPADSDVCGTGTCLGHRGRVAQAAVAIVSWHRFRRRAG